ncbi:MAG: hypothetical protein VW519_09310 [Luminiphilus sp.]
MPLAEVALPLRPAATVMELERLGSFSPTRLSFARRLTRLMSDQGWRVSCTRFDLDNDGHGEAIYRLDTPAGHYHIVVFSQHLEDGQRTDRVIAEAWDVTFGLVEGEVDADLMASLAANLPLQEAGRQHSRLLVISRANKSVRNFEAFVAALASGQQPNVDYLRESGYLYRTTAVYGNGKFGIADYDRLRQGGDFQHPFSAQMAAIYVLREFSVQQVEHIAHCRDPQRMVDLAAPIRRYLGIGNSTGLGMAPFLINHPQLISQWVLVRERALALAVTQQPDEASRARLLSLCRRAMAYLSETTIEDKYQATRNQLAREELQQITAWLEQLPLEDNSWAQLSEWAFTHLSLETQELVNTLLIELYPAKVDALDEAMSVYEKLDLSPDMPLVQLKQIIETHFDWAIAEDYSCAEARYWFWYQSAEKEEPRLGVRGQEAGEEKELSLAVGPRVQGAYGALCAVLKAGPRSRTIDLLMAHPEHMSIVRRIQAMANTEYGEIRANLWHRDMKPMHLLRAKLSCLGAHRFDPRGDRWVRVAFFQGAPILSDFDSTKENREVFDDWSFPLAPVLTEQSSSAA